jgi:putative OPT family oligopeptide transporter
MAAHEKLAQAAPEDFKPYVPDETVLPEFTPRAVVLGMLFGLIFGAVTVYVGLRAGLTVAASIPIAVLSISLLRAFPRIPGLNWVFGRERASILENNIVQTTGSAGESVAGGVIFTLPALIFLGFDLQYWRIFLLALIGGWLGVFFMIPLRRQLIVKEHGTLQYPEGTACGDVLIAGDKGGSFASRVFWGLGLGAVYTFFQNENMFAVWPSTPAWNPVKYPGSSIRANTTAEYMGVGYIIGPRVAGVIFAGGVFAWLVVMPAIKFFGGQMPTPIYPGTIPIGDMSPDQLWRSYIRPMGAGAVAASGLITLMKTIPTIVAALTAGYKSSRAGAVSVGARRTERDLDMKIALGGSLLIVAMMWAMLTFYPVENANTSMLANLAAAVFVVVFGFLFVTVSSRIAGLIGTSANPISGMAIATLMATCAVFLALGWTAPAFGALAISIGGVVCIASANAGNTSQDLKTGFIVGATPEKQQIGLMLGVLASVFAIGGTLMGMNRVLEQFRPYAGKQFSIAALPSGVEVQQQQFDRPQVRYSTENGEVRHPGSRYALLNALGSSELPDGKYLYNYEANQIEVVWIQGIGSDKAAAPQARLMATVISGILNQRLPWGLVLLGVFMVIAVELLGIRSLSFAVGFYLSIATTMAIFAGGVVRWLVERGGSEAGEKHEESDVSPGSLYASGLIAAGGIVGLLGIAFSYVETQMRDAGSTLSADTFREVLSFGSWADKAGNIHYRVAELLGGAARADLVANVIGVLAFGLLGYSLYHFARKPLDEAPKK